LLVRRVGFGFRLVNKRKNGTPDSSSFVPFKRKEHSIREREGPSFINSKLAKLVNKNAELGLGKKEMKI